MDLISMVLGGVAGIIVGLLVKGHLLAYVQKKGANLADKEDIKTLTKLVEGVRQKNQLVLEELRHGCSPAQLGRTRGRRCP